MDDTTFYKEVYVAESVFNQLQYVYEYDGDNGFKPDRLDYDLVEVEVTYKIKHEQQSC